jgi:glycosyltransferase involved in cell wall biosynthesis
MYPGAEDPDLGVFVAQMERALAKRGHEIERAVLDRRGGGKLRYLGLLRRARRARSPDVVYAHFLVPAGLIAALAQRAPLVLTAHGRDVRNVGELPGITSATRFAIRRAAEVIAVSEYLRRELENKIPEARGKTSVVSSGVDLERFAPIPRANGAHPAFVSIGSLTARKNVVRLARAFASLGEGTLTFVGDGPMRTQVQRFDRVTITGRVRHDDIPEHLAQADVVAQPSLIEPFGQSLLEALACGRSVVATRIGGPPEFVTPEAGVLVDPLDEESIADGLRNAAALPVPNPAARQAAEAHDVNEQARRVEEILARAVRGRRA